MAHRKRVRGKSARVDWWTPEHLRLRVRESWDLVLDAAACPESTLVPESWLGPKHPDPARRDALTFPDWTLLVGDSGAADRGRAAVYLNPPYSPPRVLNRFLETAARTRDAGLTVVTLIPASVGSHWWHDLVIDAGAHVDIIRGRVHYTGPHSSAGTPAPWPSAFVTYRAEPTPETPSGI